MKGILQPDSGRVPLLLAPMAGVTDLPFRRLCRKHGATGVVTEMVSAKGLLYGGRKSLELCEISHDERPCAIQLFGHEPDVLAKAAQIVQSFKPDGIDLNMGCPVPKVVSGGDGAALLRNPQLIFDIVRAVAAVEQQVGVKLRSGIDGRVSAVECALAAQQAGAAYVVIHARLREQFYAPSADWSVIAQVKSALHIPVIANGDIDSPIAAAQVLEQTGADGLMIGRAAIGNPFVFREIAAYLNTDLPIEPAGIDERLSAAREHVLALWQLRGYSGLLQARGHLSHYFKGLPNATTLRARCFQITSLEQAEDLIDSAASDLS